VPIEEQDERMKAGTPAQFLQSGFIDSQPAFSPDGRWLAYVSNESGKPEVYVRPFPAPASGQGRKWQISNSGGAGPRWSQKGHDLVYQSTTTGAIMIVRYSVKGDAFGAEPPRLWISKVGVNLSDLTPDATCVLVSPPVESAETTRQEHEVVFLENFFDYLRQRVPLPK
jgi:serine/threonine-protein kinase